MPPHSLVLCRCQPDAPVVADKLAEHRELVRDALVARFADWTVYDRGTVSWDGISTRGLLTSHAAIVLVDAGTGRSESMLRDLLALSWRLRAGLPIGVVLLGDSTVAIPDGLQAARVFRAPATDAPPEALPALAAEIADKLEADVTASGPQHGRSPSIVWITDVEMTLGGLPDGVLPSLGSELDLVLAAHDAANWRATLAANLFLAELTSAYGFLNRVARSVSLVDRAYPLWVDLDAGGTMLGATTLPKSRRVCGVQLPSLHLSGHVALRASGRSRVVQLQWPNGEDGAHELLGLYAAVLQESLCLGPNDTPAEIEKALEADRTPVFAILDCDRRPSRTAERLVDGLAARFPGVTFVLTTEAADAQLWELYEDVPIAMEALHPEHLNKVHRYVRMLGQLAADPKG